MSAEQQPLEAGIRALEAQRALLGDGVVDAMLAPARAKPRNFRITTRGIEGVATKMIGRDAELEALQAAFKRLFEDRRLAAMTVVAEAGIGKSRLLYEFEAWSDARPERFFLFRGRATPQTGTQAFGLLRDILAWRFQIADDDSIAAARQKMEEGIVPLFLHDDGPDLAEGHAHLLGHLIGIEWRDSRHIKGILDDPKQIRNRAFHAAAQVFRRVSATDGSPVILQLDDLHWADDEIELTCHQALARAGDPRAADWLERAHTAVMAQANTINDAALRKGFLQNVPHHREIVAAWAQSARRPTDPG